MLVVPDVGDLNQCRWECGVCRPAEQSRAGPCATDKIVIAFTCRRLLNESSDVRISHIVVHVSMTTLKMLTPTNETNECERDWRQDCHI
jgi:hypothetical protein